MFPNAESGFNGEHSLLDGTPTLRMNEFVLASLDKGKIDLSSPAGAKAPEPQELKWVLDGKAETFVEEARKEHVGIMSNHDLEALHFEGYGSESLL